MGRELLLWTENECRCELYPGETPGDGRLQIRRGDTIIIAEAVNLGPAAYTRLVVMGIAV